MQTHLNHAAPAGVPPPTVTEAREAAIYRKITWRLMPYLFLCYMLAFVNRVNVGFAKLQMQTDLGFSDAVYGMGAGIFFVGYFFFEVPSNLLMQRMGARRLLGSIMIIWGAVSAATLLATGPLSYYALRFVLGAVESGFFPGVILYLTYWYASRHRARMAAIFVSAVPASGIIAGPISGWILNSMNGIGGMTGWQWLFLLCGIPSSLVGLFTFWFLTDDPAGARWLTNEEKKIVLRRLAEEEDGKKRAGGANHRLIDAFRSPQVWLFCLIYFGMTAGNYGISFWLPQVIKDTLSQNPVTIGWLFVIPWGTAAAAMIAVGQQSDQTGERRWHLVLSCLVGAAAFAASAIPGIPGVLGLMALSLATAGVMSTFSVFWALPTRLLSGTAAAAGIAWINSVGNLAGYVSPHAVGLIRDRTHSMTPALLSLAGILLVSAAVTWYVTRETGTDPAVPARASSA